MTSKVKRRPSAKALERKEKFHQECMQVLRIVEDKLSDVYPVTVRQVFYNCIAGGLITKDTPGGYDMIKNAMHYLRMNQYFDFENVADNSRVTPYAFTQNKFETAQEAYQRIHEDAAILGVTKQVGQEMGHVVMTEAGGTVQQLRTVCDPLDIPVFAVKGFASLTIVYEFVRMAVELAESLETDTIMIHYAGDYDPTGMQIPLQFLNRAKEIRDMKFPWADVRFRMRRVALNEYQISALGLTTQRMAKPPMTASADWVGVAGDRLQKCELEALHPKQLQALVQASIDEDWDYTQTEAVVSQLSRNQTELKALFAM